MVDPYKLIGVDYEATDAEVKKAYHTLARKYHPDNFADDPVKGELATQKMSELNAAYEQIVSDRERGIRGAFAYAAATPPPPAEEKSAPAAEKTRRKKEKPTPPPRYQRQGEETPREFVGYERVRVMIHDGLCAAALGELFRVPDKRRDAEWHHLASLAHLGCRHLHDAFREADLAVRRDRKNKDYRRVRDEIKKGDLGFARHEPKPRPTGRLRLLRVLWDGLLRTLGLDD
ncbi:MAG: J domain-containing protein [Clostridia bacterium]|nr:J domain-containing protein [Clostridia bacterium]